MYSAPGSLCPAYPDSTAPRFATLPEWLAWQEQLHYPAIDLGLERCRRVAQRMKLLKPDFTVITIAGTNGKGSSVAMLERMLRASGYKVGSYTSPHLLNYNERICLNGVPVSDAVLCETFNLIDQARGAISLSYFEFGTLAALDIFHRADRDLVIMEVGLGGRLDAVNMLDADVALLTTIAMDHEQWLGYDRDSIGKEKAGIFRSMRPAICADLDPPESVLASAERTGAQLYLSGHDFSYEVEADCWHWACGESSLSALPKPGLNNDSQVQNAAGVLMVLHELAASFPVKERIIRRCLRDFRLAGRLQLIPAAIPYILDVAHNPQAAAALAANLGKLATTGKTHLVIAMLRDKNHAAVLQALAAVVDDWYLASLDGARGTTADELVQALSQVLSQVLLGAGGQPGPARPYDTVAAAIEAARMAALPGDRIVITGSFITVGEAMRYLQLQA